MGLKLFCAQFLQMVFSGSEDREGGYGDEIVLMVRIARG